MRCVEVVGESVDEGDTDDDDEDEVEMAIKIENHLSRRSGRLSSFSQRLPETRIGSPIHGGGGSTL